MWIVKIAIYCIALFGAAHVLKAAVVLADKTKTDNKSFIAIVELILLFVCFPVILEPYVETMIAEHAKPLDTVMTVGALVVISVVSLIIFTVFSKKQG